MSSYRPKIKLNASGETRDLPLDAETLKGKTLDYFASKSEINSGLANKQNNLSQSQLEAVNSGITSAKVSTYDGYANQINDKATASNVYSKSEVDSKDANTLNNAKSYTDTQLKTITDNIVKEVICTHQYEITGNTGDEHGLAVEDQQMLIKKIEGQTRRKSLNLFSLKPGTYAGVTLTYDSLTGIYTLNGTSNGFTIPSNNSLPQGTKISFIAKVVSGTKTGTANQIGLMIDGTWIATDWVNNKTLSQDISGNWMSAGVTFNNYKVKINVVEGTYTEYTMPMFQSYDNTLVNSNCVLKSSGRNLISSPFVSGKLDINNGNYVNDSNYLCSRDFIEWAIPNQKITVELDKTYQDTWFIEYDINKNMVDAGDWFLSQTRTFTPSSKCKYFKLSIKSNDLSTLKCAVYYGDKRNDVLDESYKQDTIDGIGSLGRYDYIDMISQKKLLATSDIVTLNGSERWILYNSNMYSDIVDKDSAQGVENLPNDSSFKIDLGGDSIRLKVETNGKYTVETWKQYLASNPIQLVYKKATPTITEVNLPNGMAVYNGGLQSQIGDVPYKITKQYNLSQKAQTLANIEIDREQQDQINEIKALNLGWEVVADNMKKYFSGDGTGSTLDTDIQNKMSDMNAIYALTFDASGGSSTDDFITKTQYGTIYLSNQIDNYYGKKVLIGNGSIISRTFGLYVITAIYSNGSLNVLTQDVQKRSSAVHLQTIKKLVLKK